MKLLPSLVFALATAAALLGCASKQPTPASLPAQPAAGSTAANTVNERLANTPPAQPSAKLPSEVRTRNAMFKLASYDDLPGWQQDDMRASWGAFRNSCDVLQKREDWREICAASKTVPPNTRAMRSFFETRFTLLRILNTDATREGDVTGYFEPLLEGQAQRDAEFNTPVMGVPRDLFTIDWSRVPKAQRRSVIRVKPEGNLLTVAATGDSASYALDLRRFDLDDRDRRLRLRLVGDAGSPA
ncbi:MAG: MltA domain-containing protein, partial [Cytophagales bacterium]|nr:MltA domain-containing protein [Rhizobacter sp.]